MARYLTTEETYQCPQCATRFALRESKQIGTNPQNPLYECPGCEDIYLKFVTYVDGFVERPFHTPLLRFHSQLYYKMWASQSGRTDRMNYDPVHIEH